MKENLQSQFPQSIHWSDGRWKACLAAGGGEKRRFQYCTDASGTIVYFRALQGHSGRNLIDPSLQDNVIIQSNFFQRIYNVGCAFNLHSIINSGLIPGGQSSSKRQTVFFFLVDPMDKSHKDLEKIDLNVPRHAQYLHKAWKRHQDAVYWVDINLAFKKGLTFHPTRSNAIILQDTLPAYCIPKVVRMETGEVLYEKVYMSPSQLPASASYSCGFSWNGMLPLGVRSADDLQEVGRGGNICQGCSSCCRSDLEFDTSLQEKHAQHFSRTVSGTSELLYPGEKEPDTLESIDPLDSEAVRCSATSHSIANRHRWKFSIVDAAMLDSLWACDDDESSPAD